MNKSFLPARNRRRRRQDGIAIILILAFIVILTGLVFAFFSRALTERQVANSGLNQSKADVFARSAVDVIVADFKQEIVAGSSPSPTGYPLYVPTSNLYAVPQTSGTPAPPAGPSPTPAIPNLIRRSVRSDPLAAPAPAAPAIRAVSTSASAVNSTVPSGNGRLVSPDRWNAHYLIPKAVTNNDDTTPVASFVAPDWVMVTTTGPTVLTAPDPTAIGRYAYAIYDEGGLLDANVAGYPVPSPTPTGIPVPAYKSSSAFANLTAMALTTATTPPTLPQAQVDSLVGWRNFASAQPGGTFGGYTFDPPAAKRYYDFVLGRNTGNLGVNPLAYPSPATATSRTDQMFNSRQSLVKFRRATGMSVNVLHLLGTFSRDLNQPSVRPNSNKTSTNPILAAASGGNDAVGGDSQALVTASGDARINPSFLDVRVAAPGGWNRNDSSKAQATEPLVKTRFSLNRLAWLTYKGPSALRTIPTTNPGTSSPDYDMWALVNLYGVPATFLSQGTAAKVKAYFGLTWAADGLGTFGDGQMKWRYDHGMDSGGKLIIGTLSKVAAANREADFVELLKASIDAGSLGRAGQTNAPLVDRPVDHNWAFTRDASVDNQVIQIFANIIDQFDVDGYPTRILFDATSPSGGPTLHREFYGVENLPYIYRLRQGMLAVHKPSPLPDNNDTRAVLNVGTNTLTDAGVGVEIFSPELWNPHSANSSTGNPSPMTAGAPAFRFVMDLTSPETINPAGTSSDYSNKISAVAYGNGDWTNIPDPKPGAKYKLADGKDYNASLPDLHSDSKDDVLATTPPPSGVTFQQLCLPGQQTSAGLDTELLFDVTNTLFREPTFLARPNKPTGSNLQAGPKVRLLTDPALKQYVKSVGGGTGINSSADDPFLVNAEPASPTTTGYLGVAVGAFPLRWLVSYTYKDPTDPRGIDGPTLTRTLVISGDGSDSLRRKSDNGAQAVRVQCKDPNGTGWMTYDVKFTDNQANVGHTLSGKGSALQSSTQWVPIIDPRTNRLGIVSWSSGYADAIPNSSTAEWANGIEGVSLTNRPDAHAGYDQYAEYFASWYMPAGAGWFPGNGSGNAYGGNNPIRMGLLSQNNPTAINDGLRSNLFSPPNAMPGRFTPTAQYYADADGIVRRATAAYVPTTTTTPATTTVGLPLATDNAQSRPIVLNRPFRSVAELGYVFSGTPWKNLDFFTPESANSALLDVCCINETDDANGLMAGKVNLNTRQAPVLKAILAGAYKDEQTANTIITSSGASSEADKLAAALFARTSATTSTGGQGPLVNLGDLIGRWTGTPQTASGGGTDGSKSYSGFSGDLSNLYDVSKPLADPVTNNIQRFRESAVRALSGSGQTRVWNLMIDVVAQTGRYPQTAASASNPLAAFVVDGEQRYWVHVAIDRFTGEVIDRQIEAVKE